MQKLKRPLNSDARQHFITRNNSKDKDLNSKCRISLSLNSANQVNLPNRLPGQQARQVVNDKKGNQHSRSLTAIATAAPSTTTAIAMKAIIKTRGRTGPTSKTTPAPCRVASAGNNAKTTVHKHYLPQQCYINGFIVLVIVISKFTLTLAISDNAADNLWASTTPLMHVDNDSDRTTTEALTTISAAASAATEADMTTKTAYWRRNATAPLGGGKKNTMGAGVGKDSIFMYFAKRLSIGNELWDGIVRECYRRPTFTCFQKNVFVYLNNALDAHDVNVTQRLKFYKNQVNYDSESPATESALSEDGEGDSDGDGDGDGADDGNVADASTKNDGNHARRDGHLMDNEIPHTGRAAAASIEVVETPIEEVTNALYGKSVKFAMTHDIEMKLPEIMFDGATFRISPRSFEGNGIIAKLELIPKQEVEARLAGKFLLKKIQKFVRSKLLLSFLALVLIIKIIKIKFFWLLPLVIGVGAAKKLLLKFLLFLFPALSHLFKLCSYYQQTYHSTKYHHHHHLINHHHTIVPQWHSAEHSSGPELIYTNPPKGHVSTYLHGAPIHETYGPPSHEHYDGGWENSGPGLGSDNFPSRLKGPTQGFTQSAPHPVYAPPPRNIPNSNNGNQLPGYPPPYQQQHHVSGGPGGGPTAAQIAAQYDPARNNPTQQQQQESLSPEVSAQLKEALRIQAEQRIIAQQQKILENQPFVQDGQPLMPKNYDPFYSPILLKIDKIVEQLGFTDDSCKERLVCSMYKDPTRYSPHSNFVSSELSRDTSELQPVTTTNEAVIRFYRLIQAARDGQDQRDCLHLYPNCNVNTE